MPFFFVFVNIKEYAVLKTSSVLELKRGNSRQNGGAEFSEKSDGLKLYCLFYATVSIFFFSFLGME